MLWQSLVVEKHVLDLVLFLVGTLGLWLFVLKLLLTFIVKTVDETSAGPWDDFEVTWKRWYSSCYGTIFGVRDVTRKLIFRCCWVLAAAKFQIKNWSLRVVLCDVTILEQLEKYDIRPAMTPISKDKTSLEISFSSVAECRRLQNFR